MKREWRGNDEFSTVAFMTRLFMIELGSQKGSFSKPSFWNGKDGTRECMILAQNGSVFIEEDVSPIGHIHHSNCAARRKDNSFSLRNLTYRCMITHHYY